MAEGRPWRAPTKWVVATSVGPALLLLAEILELGIHHAPLGGLGLRLPRRPTLGAPGAGLGLAVHDFRQLVRGLHQVLLGARDPVDVVSLQRLAGLVERVLDGLALTLRNLVAVLPQRPLGRVHQRVRLVADLDLLPALGGPPRGAGGIPPRWNFPSVRLSRAMGRSPCSTWTSTDSWLSAAVVKVSVFFVGMVVLRSMSLVITAPRVSMPSDSGVTSSSTTSLTSPVSTAAWMAAPTPTTSSGFTPLCGSFPKRAFTISCPLGIRVWPPTRMTSSMSRGLLPASCSACRHGPSVRSIRSATSDSSFARVSVSTRCLGPFASAVMNGRLISVWRVVESSHLAFSAASFSRWCAT